jgi:hypothetical protein
MKVSKPLTADAVKAPKKNRGHKALRIARRKAYYASLPSVTAKNKKRAQARHLRFFPEDAQARSQYVDRYGKGSDESPLTVPLARAVKRFARRKAIRA